MTRYHVAFLPYPAYGHMMPTLPVIAELVKRGHRVTVYASDQFVDRVRVTGATVRRYEPELCTDPPPDDVDADECARASLKLLESSTAIMPAIGARLDPNPPDLVAYDTTLWLTGRLLAARWNRPSVQLSPTFISNAQFNLSAAHERYAGRVDREHPAVVAFAQRLTEVVRGSGLSDDRQAELFHGDEEPTIAFVPREFQIAGDTFGDRYAFVGPPVDARPDGAFTPPSGDAPLLLVSLGTTVNNHPDFFRQAVAAFAEMPWRTVVALGGRIDPGELGSLPPHVVAASWVPLRVALGHATVFLCQAGMGSVMEALGAAVPMVVVPHHPEQYVNADRLVELGLARVVDRRDVTPETLRAAVLSVAADAGIRARVEAMATHVRAAGGARRAADVIEARLTAVAVETR